MRVTCLIENTSSNSSLAAEHGLSLFIETESNKILFDMGQTDLFADNAKLLGVDLAEVDIAVLSHGHYDHGGGLKRFLELNNSAAVYLSSDAFGDYYNGIEKYIGLDKSLAENERLIYAYDYFSVDDGISLFSCNDNEKIMPIDSGGLKKKINGNFADDDFLHEQYMLIEENGKKFLISGCSHKGILNICDWFRPDVLIGGFHFSKYPLDTKLDEIAEKLNSFGTEFYTCHCTGVEQYNYLSKRMKKLNYLSTGETIKLP